LVNNWLGQLQEEQEEWIFFSSGKERLHIITIVSPNKSLVLINFEKRVRIFISF